MFPIDDIYIYVRLRYKLNKKTKVKKENVSRPKAKMEIKYAKWKQKVQHGSKICKMEAKGARWKQKVQIERYMQKGSRCFWFNSLLSPIESFIKLHTWSFKKADDVIGILL